MTKSEFIKLIKDNLPPYFIANFMKFNEEIKHCNVLIKDKYDYLVCDFNISYDEDKILIFNGTNLGNIHGLVTCFKALDKIKLGE